MCKEILQMIETVDPSDTAKLDEIDARVWCYLNKSRFAGNQRIAHSGEYQLVEYEYENGNAFTSQLFVSYTRSRDALKAIRPDGWEFQITNAGKQASVCAYSDTIKQNVLSEILPTEELAELHAVIQAIAYERAQ